MTATVDWSAVELAGAFIVGAVAGAVAAIRVGRVIVEYLRRDDPPQSL